MKLPYVIENQTHGLADPEWPLGRTLGPFIRRRYPLLPADSADRFAGCLYSL